MDTVDTRHSPGAGWTINVIIRHLTSEDRPPPGDTVGTRAVFSGLTRQAAAGPRMQPLVTVVTTMGTNINF